MCYLWYILKCMLLWRRWRAPTSNGLSCPWTQLPLKDYSMLSHNVVSHCGVLPCVSNMRFVVSDILTWNLWNHFLPSICKFETSFAFLLSFSHLFLLLFRKYAKYAMSCCKENTFGNLNLMWPIYLSRTVRLVLLFSCKYATIAVGDKILPEDSQCVTVFNNMM